MRKLARILTLAAAGALLAIPVLVFDATAQMREFTGRIDTISGKKMIDKPRKAYKIVVLPPKEDD